MDLKIVDIFETSDEHKRGLQYRHIAKDECALFLYNEKRCPAFWNINVPTDLWVSAVVDGEVRDVILLKKESKVPNKFSVLADMFVESRIYIPLGRMVDVDVESGCLHLC